MKKIVFASLLTLLIAGCAVQEPAQDESTQDESNNESSSVESVEWVNVSDVPEDVPVYEGRAEIKGWIVQTPMFIDDLYPHFHVSDEDFKKFPQNASKFQNFLLKEWDKTDPTDPNFVNVSEDVIKELSSYSESNPVTIIVDRIVISQEGSPSLGLVDIVK